MSGAPPPAPRVQFPHQDALAEKWFAEAVRFLHDAYVLHQAARYAASVASSQKAAELAVKAVLILDGSLGWWDRLQQTHRPLEEIERHPILGHHRRALTQHSPQLVADVLALERLAPARSEKKDLTADDQANTEYPFFFLETDPNSGDTSVRLLGPSDYFQETQSLAHYRTARSLLTAYQAIDRTVRQWGHGLPDPL
jgi:hypothetical protein